MAQYTIVIKIPNAGNKEICYSVNLEDDIYPSDYFRDQKNRLHLRQFIENEHLNKISDRDLDLIINTFISKIKPGFRGRIPITIDLSISTPTSTPSPTPTPVSSGDDTRGNGGTSTGSNSGYPIPKKPYPPERSGTFSSGKSPSSGTGNTQQQNPEQSQNPAPPQTEQWPTSNNFDID